MKKTVFLILIGVIIIVSGCNQQFIIGEDNLDELISLLEREQTIDYKAEHRYSWCSSGGSCGSNNYDIRVENGIIVEGPSDGLTDSDIKETAREQVLSYSEEEIDEIIKVELDNGIRCFFKSPLQVCFDEGGNLIYHTRAAYGGGYSWRIPSLFSIGDEEELGKKLSEATFIQTREKRREECDNEACNNFFTLLSQPSESQYKVHYEYILKDVSSKWDIHEVLDYEVAPGEKVTGETEEDLKNKLSGTKVTCDFVERQENGLTCFDLVKEFDTYVCDIGPIKNGRFASECSYCFSNNGYLKSVECFGDSKYAEETADHMRYYRWVKT